jgi:hypothetical protein
MAKLTAILDLDWCKYTAASAGEKRTIVAIHNVSGNEYAFNTRTELWGRKKSKDEGWIGEQNKKLDTPLLHSDFTITDVQTPEPIENVLHTAKSMVEGALSNLGTTRYKGFVGQGRSFRVDRSTLLEYKGNRTGATKPLYLDDVSEYLIKKFDAEIVTGIENDDRVVMEAYKQPSNVILGCDKDFYGCPVKFFNVNRVAEGVISCDNFGSLWRDDNGKVRGKGRMFLYFQMCANDKSDNYAANCFSETKWADVSAFDALVESSSDKEAWLNVENVFKRLYPEPKEVVGWRGDKLKIDWRYVMDECFDMARMLRFEGDKVVASEVLQGFHA